MNRPDWRILPGEQLTLDLGRSENAPPPDPALAFEREQREAQLLSELAFCLGELKAAVDIESFRKSLTLTEGEVSVDP